MLLAVEVENCRRRELGWGCMLTWGLVKELDRVLLPAEATGDLGCMSGLYSSSSWPK